MQRTAFILIFFLVAALSRESFAPDKAVLERSDAAVENTAEKAEPPDYSMLPEAVFPPTHPTER